MVNSLQANDLRLAHATGGVIRPLQSSPPSTSLSTENLLAFWVWFGAILDIVWRGLVGRHDGAPNPSPNRVQTVSKPRPNPAPYSAHFRHSPDLHLRQVIANCKNRIVSAGRLINQERSAHLVSYNPSRVGTSTVGRSHPHDRQAAVKRRPNDAGRHRRRHSKTATRSGENSGSDCGLVRDFIVGKRQLLTFLTRVCCYMYLPECACASARARCQSVHIICGRS